MARGVVEPSSAPRSLDDRSRISRSGDARRRTGTRRGDSGSKNDDTGPIRPNSEVEAQEPARTGRAAGVAVPGGREKDVVSNSNSTRRQRYRDQQRRRESSAENVSSADGSGRRGRLSGNTTRTRGTSRRGTSSRLNRSPLERYLLLSVVIVILGLSFRYLWRQLAGLIGAALILSTARRRSGGTPALGVSSAPSSSSVGAARHSAGTNSRRTARRQRREAEASSTSTSAPAASDEGGKTAEGALGEREKGAVTKGGGGFDDAPTELRRFWEDAGPKCKFLVRGPKYLVDRKKIPGGPAAMRLVHVDLFAVEREVFHVASKGRCRDRVSGFFKSYENKGETAPFLFILSILVPGNPVVATVMYWALDQTTQQQQQQQQQEGGGGGDNDEGDSRSSSPSCGTTSSQDTFLRMLERYAEVTGSGYKKLERVRFPPPASFPPLSSSSTMAVVASPSPPSCASPSIPESSQSQQRVPSQQRQKPKEASSATSPSQTVAGVAVDEGNNQSSTKDVNTNGNGNVNGVESTGSTRAPDGSAAVTGGDGSATVGQQGQEEGNGGDSGSVVKVPAGRGGDMAGLLPESDFRNQRFKLIPSIVSGPFIVRKAVGNKPALLGRKVSQRYFRGPGYVETDVDVGSSMIAEKIVSLCRGYARGLTVELGICLEGRCEEELPEKVMGAIRLVNLDLDKAEPLHDKSQPLNDSSSAMSSAEGFSSSSERHLPVGLNAQRQ